MVSKSLTLIALLLCAILAQTIAVKTTSKADKADSEDEADSNDGDEDSNDDEDGSGDDSEDEDEETLYPSLSCLLFKDIGCNSECSVMGSAFGHKATGTCDKEDNICDCAIAQLDDDSLDSLWNEKFDSKNILKQIKKDEDLSEQVRDILNNPFQTAEEAKNELESVLSEDQHKKLKLKDDSEAAKMIKEGKLDSSTIKKYVTNKLPKTLKTSDTKKLSTLKLKPLLLDALKNAKEESEEQENDAFDELISDVRRTQNKSLGNILTKYFKKNNLKAPTNDKKEPSVADSIADYVIDELVKKINKKKPTTTVKKLDTKKPIKKTVQKTKSKKSKDDDSDDDADSSAIVLQKDRFKLKNFDKSLVQKSGQMNQNWAKNGYSVRYQRSAGGCMNLAWAKGDDLVRIQNSAGGNYNQHWKFGDVTIGISKSAGGNVNENWNFGNTSYQYSKGAGGYENLNWSTGKADGKTLKMYKRFIDAWCKANDFFIERESCVIYTDL